MPEPAQTPDGMTAQVLVKLGEMGAQLAVIGEQLKTAAGTNLDHEGRIRALERFRFSLMGAAIVVSLASSAAGSLITWLIEHH
jgi:hypothetical protein